MNENPTVLVVEDDPHVADLITLILRKLHAIVHYRNNGQDALSFLDQFTPDILILDLSMPVMNGWQFLELMREDPAKRDIPVIVLTAHADSTNRLVGQMQGVKAFLNKPIMPDDLRHQVARILNS